MRFRKLRIAWSVFWGLACVLLIALWVRSYLRTDHIVWTSDARTFDISTLPGKLSLATENDRVFLPLGWSHGSFSNSDDDSDPDDEPRTLLGFGWETKNGSSTVVLPYWCLVLFASALVTAWWIPWTGSFSLRTLLIATSLIAVGLGAIVYFSS
jgi:hypothetical protein